MSAVADHEQVDVVLPGEFKNHVVRSPGGSPARGQLGLDAVVTQLRDRAVERLQSVIVRVVQVAEAVLNIRLLLCVQAGYGGLAAA